ncbi:MAG: imidazole glycerol phosphate synthase subunit HisH [Candidatus Caldarchaeum sp.]
MTRCLILHYGVGNVFSVENAFKRLGFEVEIASRPRRDTDCAILPGVGSFAAAAENIAPYRDDLLDLLKTGIPVLGICLGMQVLFESSEEGPGKGLGVFKGRVVALPDTVKRPHMGWNKIRKTRETEILGDVGEEWVYFNHTYHPSPVDDNIVLARTRYGVEFPSIVGSGNIYGTQFHPEKSSKTGEKILRNFRRVVRV